MAGRAVFQAALLLTASPLWAMTEGGISSDAARSVIIQPVPSPETMKPPSAGRSNSDYVLDLKIFDRKGANPLPRDKEQPVGIQPKDWPWTSVGRVNVESVGHCSGALIAADQVLTAYHCLRNTRTGRLVAPRQVFFLAGYALGEAAARAAVEEFRLPPEAADTAARLPLSANQRAASDWVVLKLSAPLKMDPIPVGLLTPEAILWHARQTTAFFRAGYPRERAHMMRLQGGCHIIGAGLGGQAPVFDCATMAGESGGPVLLECKGRWQIAAINIAVAATRREELALAVVPDLASLRLPTGNGRCATEEMP
jgi:protease YdgD